MRWVRKGRISGELIRSIDEKAYEEMKEIVKDRKVLVHLHELLMLGEVLPKEASLRALEEEFGKVETEKLEKLVTILEKTGIIEIL